MEELGRCEAEAVPPEPNERQAARRRGGHEGEDDAYFNDCSWMVWNAWGRLASQLSLVIRGTGRRLVT